MVQLKLMKKILNSISYILHSRKGFTLLELLLFSAIFSITVMAFIAVLISVMRVQVRESTAAEVDTQSQFLLGTVERYVEQSSVIEMAKDISTSTLKLRMSSSTEDPIYIYLSSGIVYLKQTDAGTPQALTSPKVTVSSLVFTKHENGGGHHSVSVSFSVAYNSPNPQQQFTQALQTAITRVSAATFDSGVFPSSGATNFKLGASSQAWQSINDVMYFNGANVGVGIGVQPNATLQVHGGDIYADTVGNGIILRSPSGACWRITASNAGALTTSSVTCP